MKHTLGLGHIWQMFGVLVFCTLVPLGLGLWLDRRLDSSPLFVLVLAGMGIVAATVGIVRIAGRTLQTLGGPPEAGAGLPGSENGKEDRA